MMTRAHRAAAAAAVALLLPASALGFEWQGRLGLEYREDTAWIPDQGRQVAPRLDLDAALDLRGFVYRPGTVDWSAGAGYHRTRARAYGVRSDFHDSVTYGLRTFFFGDPRSPASFTLHANQTQTDYAVATGSGDYTTRQAGADFRLAPRIGPVVTGGYEYTDVNETDLVGRDFNRYLHALSAGVAQGGQSASTTLDYHGQLSTGTRNLDNFDDHRIALSSHVQLAPHATAIATGNWYKRTPTEAGLFNASQEQTSFSGVVQHLSVPAEAPPAPAPGGWTPDSQGGTYQYVHGLQRAQGGEEERTLHRATAAVDQLFPDPAWRLRASALATYDEDRRTLATGSWRDRLASQSLSALVYWRRGSASLLEVHAGPSFGFLERMPETPTLARGTLFGQGAEAGFRLSRAYPSVNLSGDYLAAYSHDLNEAGTRVHQQASVNAGAPAGLGVVQARLSAEDDHRDGRASGGSSRALTAQVDYRRYVGSLSVLASLTDGVQGSLRDPYGGGTFIAPSYNVHSATVSATGTLRLVGGLSLQAHGRYTSNDLPDRPALSELEGGGGLLWSMGLLRVSVDDRYIVSQTGYGDRRFNQFFIRAYRVFSGGF